MSGAQSIADETRAKSIRNELSVYILIYIYIYYIGARGDLGHGNGPSRVQWAQFGPTPVVFGNAA